MNSTRLRAAGPISTAFTGWVCELDLGIEVWGLGFRV